MSIDDFLQEYELKIEKEFEINGVPAQWASGVLGPRFWGDEDAIINLDEPDIPAADGGSDMAAACSSDQKFIAISLDNRIYIYDIETREMRSEALGHDSNIQSMHFLSPSSQDSISAPSTHVSPSSEESPTYLLFVEGERDGLEDGVTVVWKVDASGRLLVDTAPLAVEQMVESAMASISTHFAQHPDMVESEIQAIRSGLTTTLKRVDLRKGQKQRQVLPGRFPSFDSEPFSRDGKQCIFITYGRTTQHGMRSADELPQIVVWDIANSREVCRLQGHTDAITWASWAADDQAIVTASWDETFKFWDAQTGRCEKTIGPTGGQNWKGSVSPDGQYCVLSGGQPTQVTIYMINGIKSANVDCSALLGRRSSWIREINWSPKGNEIAITSGRKVCLVNPNTGNIETIVQLEDDGTMLNSFATFRTPRWFDEGRKLVLRGSDKTIYVWDREENCKWRFQRPQGVQVDHYNQSVYYLADRQMIVSVDGDLKVRFWNL